MNTPHLRYKKQTPRERTWTIHLISAEKVLKASVVVAAAVKLLTFVGHDIQASASEFVSRHGIDIANRYVQALLERLAGVGDGQLIQWSTLAFVYAALLYVEGIGLWLQKRWAEYLTVIATGLFIPIEIYEIYVRFTWVRITILALNIFVVWYLATRLKDEKKESATEDTEKFRTKIKICGITNLEDALLSVKLGADQLGFNFYKNSPRYVTPELSRSIIAEIPESVLKVGVFVNETVETICEIIHLVGLDAIQLHGNEDNRFIEKVHMMSGLPVIKALPVSPDFNPNDAARSSAEAILLDKYSPREPGGTGETFDWKIAQSLSPFVERMYLAGGLAPENVAEAITKVQPYAVDACSKLESAPGKKDAVKLRRFIAAVRGTI